MTDIVQTAFSNTHYLKKICFIMRPVYNNNLTLIQAVA